MHAHTQTHTFVIIVDGVVVIIARLIRIVCQAAICNNEAEEEEVEGE